MLRKVVCVSRLTMTWASHPDILQLILQQTSIRLLQTCPLLVSSHVSSLTFDDDFKEHHLLGEATEAVVKADLVISLHRRFHTGMTGSKAKNKQTGPVMMSSKVFDSHMDAVRATGLKDEPDAFWRDDGEVYVHSGACYHLCRKQAHDLVTSIHHHTGFGIK